METIAQKSGERGKSRGRKGEPQLRVRPCLGSDPRIDPLTRLRCRARRDGYLLVRGLVEAKLVVELRAQVVARCADFGWVTDSGGATGRGAGPDGHTDPRFVELQQHVAGASAFQELIRLPVLPGLLKAITGNKATAIPALVCRAVPPARPEATTPPHQDSYYLGRTVAAFWVAWLPLGDCPLELGPLAMLRGSHRNGPCAHTSDSAGRFCAVVDPGPGRPAWRASAMRAGDVLLFHHHTVHQACPNVTKDRFRFSADFRFRIG